MSLLSNRVTPITSNDLQALLRASWPVYDVRPFDVYQRSAGDEGEPEWTEYAAVPVNTMPHGTGWRATGRMRRDRSGGEHWGPINPVPATFTAKRERITPDEAVDRLRRAAGYCRHNMPHILCSRCPLPVESAQ